MLLRLAPAVLVTSIALAQGVEIYSNGPLVTGMNGANPISVLQFNTPPNLSVFGYGAQAAVPNRLADQFAVNTLMILDGIEVFGYATGVLTPSLTAIELCLWDGNPSTGTPNQLLPGAGNGVNLIGATGYTVTNTLTGIYRVLDTTPADQNRPIQSVRVDFAPITLNPGIYYLQWAYTGLNFCPPLTTLNQPVTGDGLQQQTATWVSIVSGTPAVAQGLPFKLYGTQITPPGAITNLGGGCNSVAFDVKGSPAVGGYVRAELGAVNPLTFGAIVLSLSQPIPGGLPLLCGCVLHVNPDVVIVGSGLGAAVAASVMIPANAALVGIDLYAQGAQLDVLPAAGLLCNLGIAFDLTAGYRVHLY